MATRLVKKHMKILFIGDVFAKPGRQAVKKLLKPLKEEYKTDLVIANAENIRHGKGVGEEQLNEMMEAGVDFFTSGNHVFKNREIIPFLDDPKLRIVRPANYPEGVPGKGYRIIETALMKKVLVVNLMGRLFIRENGDCPFRTVDKILRETGHENLDAIFVDFHAEATSEKIALAQYLDGRVSAVIGTHTHVATADERLLAGGTAFQSDAGFVGPLDSIIGLEKEPIIDQFLTQLPVKHEIARGEIIFNGTLIETEGPNRASSIVRVKRTIDEY